LCRLNRTPAQLVIDSPLTATSDLDRIRVRFSTLRERTIDERMADVAHGADADVVLRIFGLDG